MSPPRPGLRAVLIGAIRFYRRRISGRGPLARVRCTFHGLETCSAFGERAAREAPSATAALGRIARRLVRCRSLSLYRLAGGKLGWGRGYDEATLRIEDALARDGELPETIAAARRSSEAVMAARGGAPSSAIRGRGLLVRDGEAVRRAAARRMGTRGSILAIVLGLLVTGTLAGSLSAGAIVVLVTMGLAAGASCRASFRLARRLERQEVLAAIEGPRRISGSERRRTEDS